MEGAGARENEADQFEVIRVSLNVFESPASTKTRARLKRGDLVYGTGPVEVVKGYKMQPIRQGAVESKFLRPVGKAGAAEKVTLVQKANVVASTLRMASKKQPDDEANAAERFEMVEGRLKRIEDALESSGLLDPVSGAAAAAEGRGKHQASGIDERLQAMVGATKDLASAQELVRALGHALVRAQELVERLTEVQLPSSRTGYLRSLNELLPPVDRPWQEELPLMVQDWCRDNGRSDVGDMIEKSSREGIINKIMETNSGNALTYPVQHFGWKRFDIEDLLTLMANVYKQPMAKALRNRDPAYTSSTLRIAEILASRLRGGGANTKLPGNMFCNLRGEDSLVSADPAWADIDKPDETGYCGLVCSSAVMATCMNSLQKLTGYKPEGAADPQESDVVCFVSRPSDQGVFHSAVTSTPSRGYFPPNTLFTLQETKKPGEWHWTGESGGDRGICQQRLLVVHATFMDPFSGSTAGGSSKMTGSVMTLQYGSRDAYITGLQDVTAKPLLTMQQEFDREVKWSDWKGKWYTLREEWQYVCGKAVRLAGCTPGIRDDNNDGKSLEDFQREVNDFIRARRGQGHGVALLEKYSVLTLDEVRAVRLYSGPAYDPLNKFLRQLSQLFGKFRATIARSPELTFSATVGHLCHAIRKLAAVATPEEVTRTLFRGVRGVLPKGFWMPDQMGMVCATDCAFMSTSVNRSTPIDYMGDGENVIWELEAGAPTDVGYHYGADISRLSQFAAEAEVLFPPYTLLVAKKKPQSGASKSNSEFEELVSLGETDASQCEEGGKKFVAVRVRPNFV